MPILAASTEGVVLSLFTALCWAISPMCVASAGRKIGSFPVLLLRSLAAAFLLLAMLPIYIHFAGLQWVWPSGMQMVWLVLSSITGMVIGDALLYEGLVLLGPRRCTQILTLAPVAAVLLGWWLLGEHLNQQALGGIGLVLAATAYATAAKPPQGDESREPGRLTVTGIALAVGAAFCVGAGAATGRLAFKDGPPLDAVVATVIRVGTAAVLLWVIPLAQGTTGQTLGHLRDRFILGRLAGGIATGPICGMLCYLFALKNLEAGLVSTLVAMSPLFILPMMAIRYRMRIGLRITAATGLATVGVALITLR
ncbi:MAG TPA: DMT family transporter [Phycisphaerae bacterium]|nr:DMT family transporter [Phycisphaerae bacterium]HRY67918.1 DMT family transporter [Phycisphaerae bacterium]